MRRTLKKIISLAAVAGMIVSSACPVEAFWAELEKDDPGYTVSYDGNEYSQSWFAAAYKSYAGPIVTLVDHAGGGHGYNTVAVVDLAELNLLSGCELLDCGLDHDEGFYTAEYDAEGNAIWGNEDIESALQNEMDERMSWYEYYGMTPSGFVFPSYYTEITESVVLSRYTSVVYWHPVLTSDNLDEILADLEWAYENNEWLVIGFDRSALQEYVDHCDEQEVIIGYELPEGPIDEAETEPELILEQELSLESEENIDESEPETPISSESSTEPTPITETEYIPVYTTALTELEKQLSLYEIKELSYADAELAHYGGLWQMNTLQLEEGASINGETIEPGIYTTDIGTTYEVTESLTFRLLSELKENIYIEAPGGNETEQPDGMEGDTETLTPEDTADCSSESEDAVAEVLRKAISKGNDEIGELDEESGSPEDEADEDAPVYELSVYWTVTFSDLAYNAMYIWVVRDSEGRASTDELYNGIAASSSYERVDDWGWNGTAVIRLEMSNANDIPLALNLDMSNVSEVIPSGAAWDGIDTLTIPADATATATVTIDGSLLSDNTETVCLLLRGIMAVE